MTSASKKSPGVSLWGQTRLLVWKNYVLKKRHPMSTLSEILLPLGFVALVVWMQTLDPDVNKEEAFFTCPRQSSISPTLLFPEDPEEHKEFVFELSTEGFGPGVMTVPPFAYLMLIASKIQYVIGLAPSDPDDEAQVAWLSDLQRTLDHWSAAFDLPGWSQLSNVTRELLGFGFCRFGRISKMFNSTAELRNYVASDAYGTSRWPSHEACPDEEALEKPKLHMALVLNKAGYLDGVWDYEIQTNISVIPYTYPKLGYTEKIESGVNEMWTDQYMMSGFLTLQHAVDRFIIGHRVPESAYMDSLALRQICDTVDPLLPYLREHISDVSLHGLNCTHLLERFVPKLGLDMSPFTTPASFIPNDVRMAEFPIPRHIDRPFYLKIKDVFGLDLVLTFLWPISRLIRGIVHEKETRIREGMRMMGLRYTALYLSWFVTYGLLFLVISVLVTLMTHVHLLSSSDPSLVFVYFFLFGVSIIAYCFMVSVLFSRAKTASTAGVVLFFMGFFAFFGVSSQNATAEAKTWSCLLSPTAFGLGAQILASYEAAGMGVTWANGYDTPSDNQIPFMQVLHFLVLDTFIYLAVTFYLDNVLPQEFGVPKPPNFLCTRRFWAGSRRGRTERAHVDSFVDPETGSENPFIEARTRDQQQLLDEERCVKINGLTKRFSTASGEDKVAVNSLSMDMYEGQITCLLGNNGAGKSTAVSMLTGLIPVTAGSASVFGMDVETDMDEIRQTLGVCPQHDVLFPELTVQEHLEFFAALKRVDDIPAEVDRQIAEIGLTEKRHVCSGNLSGGQKRKLSVAIALLGGSKLVILDEPTAGMDAYSRRSTWNMLQENRAGRIILLTTHFMDEADLLGDRIGIMANGSLRCCGTSIFLKSKFGIGYTLTFALKNASVKTRSEADLGGQEKGRKVLTARLLHHLPDAEIFSSVGAEVAVKVPFRASPTFPALFREIEAEKEALSVSSYGISVTTLEEVFLKVASDNYGAQTLQDDEAAQCGGYQRLGHGQSGGELNDAQQRAQEALFTQVSEWHKFRVHFRAIYVKRFHYAKRDRKSLCCNTLLPVLLLVIGLALLKAFPLKTAPPLLLGTEQFKQDANYVPFNTSFHSSSTSTNDCGSDCGTYPWDLVDSAVLVDAEIERGLNNSCPPLDPSGEDIPDGSNLKGMSRWLLDHMHENKTSIYGALHFSAVDLDRTVELTILNNSTAKHGPGVFLNMVNQALARWVAPSDTPETTSVTTIRASNHPFPFTARVVTLLDSFSAVSAAISIVIAFSFVPASVAIFVVKENEISAKHQQLISGASIGAYWVSNFAWDLCMYLVPWVASIVAVNAFQISAFEGENFVAVVLLFLLYGVSVIPFTYCLSFLFDSHSTAQNLVLLLNFITGLVLIIASFVMSVIESTMHVNRILKYVYRLFPGYCLGNGLLGLTVNHSLKEFLPEDFSRSPFDWDVVGAELCYMAASSVLYFVLTVAIDLVVNLPWFAAVLQRCKSRISRALNLGPRGQSSATADVQAEAQAHDPLLATAFSADEDVEDDDVAMERDRIDAEYDTSEDAIVLSHLRKVYPDGKVAVRGLTFGIAPGEIMGFIGTNGAGKSTSTKMLTGEVLPSSGKAKLVGNDIIAQQSNLRRMIGYCPQFDALLELLTVREHLELYARIKCIPEDLVGVVAEEKMKQLNLEEFHDKTAGTLSGGNRRKLSVAIAMVGAPPLIFCDEPTTGMDPYNKRFLLDVIAGIPTGRGGGRKGTVVFTSHSMEECEAICTQVGIMVSGQFKCFGSIQHLKSRFGKGLMINVRTAAPTQVQADDVVAKLSPILVPSSEEPDARTAIPADQVEEACRLLGIAKRFQVLESCNSATAAVIADLMRPQDGLVDGMLFAEWWLHESLFDKVSTFLQQYFSGAVCIERRGNSTRWRIDEQNESLAHIFDVLETHKEAVGVVEYALSQTTLEQIFVMFASQQKEETAHAVRERRRRAHAPAQRLQGEWERETGRRKVFLGIDLGTDGVRACVRLAGKSNAKPVLVVPEGRAADTLAFPGPGVAFLHSSRGVLEDVQWLRLRREFVSKCANTFRAIARSVAAMLHRDADLIEFVRVVVSTTMMSSSHRLAIEDASCEAKAFRLTAFISTTIAARLGGWARRRWGEVTASSSGLSSPRLSSPRSRRNPAKDDAPGSEEHGLHVPMLSPLQHTLDAGRMLASWLTRHEGLPPDSSFVEGATLVVDVGSGATKVGVVRSSGVSATSGTFECTYSLCSLELTRLRFVSLLHDTLRDRYLAEGKVVTQDELVAECNRICSPGGAGASGATQLLAPVNHHLYDRLRALITRVLANTSGTLNAGAVLLGGGAHLPGVLSAVRAAVHALTGRSEVVVLDSDAGIVAMGAATHASLVNSGGPAPVENGDRFHVMDASSTRLVLKVNGKQVATGMHEGFAVPSRVERLIEIPPPGADLTSSASTTNPDGGAGRDGPLDSSMNLNHHLHTSEPDLYKGTSTAIIELFESELSLLPILDAVSSKGECTALNLVARLCIDEVHEAGLARKDWPRIKVVVSVFEGNSTVIALRCKKRTCTDRSFHEDLIDGSQRHPLPQEPAAGVLEQAIAAQGHDEGLDLRRTTVKKDRVVRVVSTIILHIIEAQDLAKSDRFGRSDPYCVVSFNGERLGKTAMERKTLTPHWDERIYLSIPGNRMGRGDLLTIDVFDHDTFSSDDFLGRVTLAGNEIVPRETFEWHELCPRSDLSSRRQRFVQGKLRLRFSKHDFEMTEKLVHFQKARSLPHVGPAASASSHDEKSSSGASIPMAPPGVVPAKVLVKQQVGEHVAEPALPARGGPPILLFQESDDEDDEDDDSLLSIVTDGRSSVEAREHRWRVLSGNVPPSSVEQGDW
ncbi:ABC transporter A family member 1 (ABC transporter ABCA.1) (AtABCA1) (ABC one homolog protein 1) (AtAOH1) [Durusdinium trenchii]|uniref:ABC transporter A family member 1 (ABC transporter ABCA.1) (AtABCA1) (ABC one homolog protein 1) (AtAOH1) n=1 Tax=Durusdinium trenchii TaxID=1381693 RepID=A0ABP0S8R7_9DINO